MNTEITPGTEPEPGEWVERTPDLEHFLVDALRKKGVSFFEKSFNIGKRLGEGAQGFVFELVEPEEKTRGGGRKKIEFVIKVTELPPATTEVSSTKRRRMLARKKMEIHALEKTGRKSAMQIIDLPDIGEVVITVMPREIPSFILENLTTWEEAGDPTPEVRHEWTALMALALESILDQILLLHKEGIVHRDVAPKNLIVNAKILTKGRAGASNSALIDFGVALDIERAQNKLNTRGVVPGNPYFSYPALLKKGEKIDIRIFDIWGAVLSIARGIHFIEFEKNLSDGENLRKRSVEGKFLLAQNLDDEKIRQKFFSERSAGEQEFLQWIFSFLRPLDSAQQREEFWKEHGVLDEKGDVREEELLGQIRGIAKKLQREVEERRKRSPIVHSKTQQEEWREDALTFSYDPIAQEFDRKLGKNRLGKVPPSSSTIH